VSNACDELFGIWGMTRVEEQMSDENLEALGRALTDEQKREVLDRIYVAWVAMPHQRLGQLIVNSLGDIDVEQYVAEDRQLAEAVERFVASWGKS
jgi:hypothetical protein